MRSSARNVILAGFSTLVLGALASAAPPTTINPADAKAAVRKASDAALIELRRDLPELKFCQGFRDRKKQLEAELKSIEDRLAICLGN